MAGFHGIKPERLEAQADGLALIDAELVALVEVPSEGHLETLKSRLSDKHGVTYHHRFIAQGASADHPLNIAVLFKDGVTVENVELLDGSDGGDQARRSSPTS